MALINNPGSGGNTNFTDGSIPYSSGGILTENNTNFKWDNATTTLYVNGVSFTPGKYSASTGASFVGFAQSGTGAVSTDLQSYLRLLRYVQGWIPTTLWAGIAARTNSTDLTAYIQAANDAVGLSGGGKLTFPSGDYLCSTATTGGGITNCLVTRYDNVEWHLEAGVRLYTSINAYLLGCGGVYKPAGTSLWYQYNARDSTYYGGAPFTLYAISSASKYANAVTLTTPAQSSNFAVGDWILIRTGETLTAGTKTPIGEYNKIRAINGGTGALTLEYPLRNAYAQEVYPVGHPSAGLNAPFGIINLTQPTNVILLNFSITGPGKMENTSVSTTPLINGTQIVNRLIDGPEFVSYDHAFSDGSTLSRHVNSKVHMLSTGNKIGYSQDACNHDSVLDNTTISSVGSAQVHLHEGCSAKIGSGVTIISAAPVSGANAISVRARAHDISIGDVKIFGFGTDAASPAIYADNSTTKITIGSAHIVGAVSAAAAAIDIEGTNSSVGVVTTDTGVLVQPDIGNSLAGDITRFVAATDMNITGGTPVLQALGDPANSQHWVWSMPNAASSLVGFHLRLPPGWKQAKIRLWFTNISAGAGNVVWNAYWRVRATTVTLNSGVDGSTGATIAAPSQWVLKVAPDIAGTITQLADASEIQMQIQRNGVSGSDTLAGAIGLLGVELLRIF